ncbi:prostaglandin F2-alpha receptor [Osmerus eperlanus]|uniref:prostaglandin F2-alpha receptor n=1 Tax=Osmerus eperlanus TaxID=29151 RepID=UPI002E1221E2
MSTNGSAETSMSEVNVINITCSQIELSITSSAISMTVGIFSNTLALVILVKAYHRFHLKSKTSFLLFASGLVVTDILGHLINGSLVLYVYSSHKRWETFDQHHILCSLFGASMVFFGLSPLLFGSVMAVDRCLGVTRPLCHSTALVAHDMKRLLGFTWLLAAFVALLPILLWRPYQVQRSQSWCFFYLEGPRDWLDVLPPLLFSLLGLFSLVVSIVCNTLTSCTLLQSRLWQEHHCKVPSHHFEMVYQLLAIMLVSCVCWGPLLVNVIFLSTAARNDQAYSRLLLVVRMATWNQILDPWVYILLRKAVLKKLFRLLDNCCGSRSSPALHQFKCKGSEEPSTSFVSRPHSYCLDSLALPDTRIKHGTSS